MKPFQFQQFTINQSKNVFRVGTDAILLGTLAFVENSKKILEIGTGTGVVSLMIAQKNQNAEILAIDIDYEAFRLASENFENSPFHRRLKAKHQDFKHLEFPEKFDLIISNPPYFEENNSSKDVLARQQRELSFRSLIKKSVEFLDRPGTFAVIIPFESGSLFEEICNENQLYLQKRTTVYGMKNSKPKRLILKFGFENKKPEETEIVVEKSTRNFTEEYLELTKEFHLFSEKNKL
jgi:tRNA1Val (adenine37-N6)-methyltransferase